MVSATPPDDLVLVHRDMLFDALRVFDELELWVHGAMTAAGKEAMGPWSTLEDVMRLREAIYMAACPTTMAERNNSGDLIVFPREE